MEEVKRYSLSGIIHKIGWSALPPVLAILGTLLIAASFMVLVDISPSEAFGVLFRSTLSSIPSVCNVLRFSVPYILAGLSVGIAMRAGMWNIGAEGQLQFGGLGALVAGLATGSSPVGFVAGVAAGSLWGGIAGVLKAYRGVNEIIVTIMLNFIAMYIVNNAVLGPLCFPTATAPYTYSIPYSARLPILVSGTTLHLGFLLALGSCVAFALWFKYTSAGFRIRLMGLNLRALTFSGSVSGRFQLLAMLLAGGAAGAAGAAEVLGVRYYLSLNWSRGWGWPAIAVAFLARGNPLVIIPVGIFYAIFDAGSLQVQIATGLPRALVDVMQGLPLVLLIVFQTLLQRWMKLE